MTDVLCNVNVSVSRRFIYRINAKPPMRWYASKRRKEESSDNVWKSRLTEPYLWCCLAVRSRPSNPQQRRPDGRTACDGGVERRPSMAEPCAADNGGQSCRACSRLAAAHPASAVRHAVTQTVMLYNWVSYDVSETVIHYRLCRLSVPQCTCMMLRLENMQH